MRELASRESAGTKTAALGLSSIDHQRAVRREWVAHCRRLAGERIDSIADSSYPDPGFSQRRSELQRATPAVGIRGWVAIR